MSSKFLPMILFFVVSIVVVATVDAAAAVLQQDGQANGYIQQQQEAPRVPVLYEAFYPEPRDLNAQTRLQEIDKLRELTNELLEQEERLKQLAAEITPEENVFAPRSQVLEYVFSRPVIPLNERIQTIPASSVPSNKLITDDVGIASLTVNDQPKHKIRHHHGEWLLRRLAADHQ